MTIISVVKDLLYVWAVRTMLLVCLPIDVQAKINFCWLSVEGTNLLSLGEIPVVYVSNLVNWSWSNRSGANIRWSTWCYAIAELFWLKRRMFNDSDRKLQPDQIVFFSVGIGTVWRRFYVNISSVGIPKLNVTQLNRTVAKLPYLKVSKFHSRSGSIDDLVLWQRIIGRNRNECVRAIMMSGNFPPEFLFHLFLCVTRHSTTLMILFFGVNLAIRSRSLIFQITRLLKLVVL